jgi:hypothetical protein
MMATKKRSSVYMLRVTEGRREDHGWGGYWVFDGAYGAWCEKSAADGTTFATRKDASEGRKRWRKDHDLRTEIVHFVEVAE